jgi:predicted ATP-grasp superfamily ATP-dependent carboligase
MSRDRGIVGTTALITDAERRKSLPLIRSLGRAGVRVVVASSHHAPLGAFSRYCDRVLRYPDYETDPDGFLTWLQDVGRRHAVDVLYPIEDRSLALCVQHADRWAVRMRALLPSPAALERAGDKWETLQCARALGIPLPESYCPGSEEDVRCLAAAWDGPMVVKPRMSSGSRGLRFVEESVQLFDAYRQVAAQYPRPVVQRRVPAAGQGLGVFALLDPDRRPLAIFGHRRLREYPITGGPSTLRESYRDEALIEQSIRLLRAMEMVGVAMVEYKVDPCSGRPLLMEINPRFWGSLQLAVLAGVDFPVLYHKASLGMDVEPVLTYPEGVLCRWLWPGDLLHFLHNPRRFHLKPSFFQVRGMGDDILSARDPLPAIGMLLEGLRKLRRGAR